jgi:hypothetical protein
VYEIEVRRAADGWTCRSRLSLQSPGRWPVAVEWREPTRLGGRATRVDAGGLAAVRVRALRRTPAGGAPAFGAWSCGPDQVETSTADDGRFDLGPLDAGSSWLVVAGGADEPRGIAAVLLDTPWRSVELGLRPAVRVEGRVVDTDDRPLGCEIRSDSTDPLVQTLAALTEETASTTGCEADGRFALGPLYPAPSDVSIIPASGRRLFFSIVPPATEAIVDLGVIRVEPGVPVRVRVTAEDGAPVEGAEVTLVPEDPLLLQSRATTGRDGWAEVEAGNVATSLRLTAVADGYFDRTLRQLSLEDAPFEVQLESAGRIRGVVLGPDGEPFAGAKVAFRPNEPPPGRLDGGFSDDEGRWEISSAPPGPGKLAAAAVGYRESAELDLTVEKGRVIDAPDLRLGPPLGRIEGLVVSPSGVPVEGAVASVGGLHTTLGTTISDEHGRFALPGSAGAALTVRKEGYGQARVAPIPVGVVEPIRVQLHEECRLIAHLPENLHAGAVVEVEDGGHATIRAPVRGRTTLEIGGLGPGPGQTWLTLPPGAGGLDGHEGAIAFDLAPGATAEVTFGAGAVVEGRVTLEGRPASLAMVTAFAAGSLDLLAQQATDHGGHFRLQRIPPGPLRLEAHASEARALREVTVPDSGTVEADLEITPVVLELLVTDAADGAPLVASAKLVPEGQAEFRCAAHLYMGFFREGFPDFELGTTKTACAIEQTGPTGRARLVLPQEGRYALQVSAKGYERHEASVSLVGTVGLHAELDRSTDEEEKDDEPAGTMVFVVVDIPEGAPPGSLQCRNSSEGQRHWKRASRGRIECGRLTPGPGEAWFHSEGYGASRVSFEVPGEGPLEVPLPVGRGGSVVVPVTEVGSRPVLLDAAGVDWGSLLGNRNADFRYVAEAGTAWILQDVPPGEYTVIVGGVARAAVRVQAGEAAVAW